MVSEFGRSTTTVVAQALVNSRSKWIIVRVAGVGRGFLQRPPTHSERIIDTMVPVNRVEHLMREDSPTNTLILSVLAAGFGFVFKSMMRLLGLGTVPTLTKAAKVRQSLASGLTKYTHTQQILRRVVTLKVQPKL